MQRLSRVASPRRARRVVCSGLDNDSQQRELWTRNKLQWQEYYQSLKNNFLIDTAEHKDLIQRAAGTSSLSFGFSAGGCLFPYYIGVAGSLKDAGILTEDTRLGGASAGSIIASCIKSGMPLDQVTEQCLRLMDDCRRNGTRGRLGPVLETFLQNHLPDDAHLKCKNKSFIAVTAAFPYVKPKLVSEFHSRDDLIRAIMTSCHVPYWLDNKPVTEFRGRMHFDGGLTNFIPVPPDTIGVRVCCFPSKQLSPVYHIGISPDTFEPWPYKLSQMVAWAFEPADEKMTLYFIEKGKQDAEAWMEAMGLQREKVGAVAAEEFSQHQGEVAAAKRAAAGTGDEGVQERKKLEQEERMEKTGKKVGEEGVVDVEAVMMEKEPVGAAGASKP